MPSFAYESLPVSEIQSELIKKLREVFSELEAFIKAGSPSGRYQSIALTQLEQAAMWSIKSVTHGQLARTPESRAIDTQSSISLNS